MKNFFQNLFLRSKLFLYGGVPVVFFILGFVYFFFYVLAFIALLLVLALLITDVLLLFRKDISISCTRKLPLILSLSDNNTIELSVTNNSILKLLITINEELPKQFQERNFVMEMNLIPRESKVHQYKLRPVTRGEYFFGNTIIYLSSLIGLAERRIVIKNATMIPVFPSIIQMKNMELRAFSKISMFRGIRKLRRFGHSYEFEQIRNYVTGDDYRSINWKSTGKRGSLMVNQYEDEKAQQVYFILDKSRVMRSTFNELTLLDYSINTTLAMSNIILRKDDKAGLISFSTTIDTFVKADKSVVQLRKILNKLYAEKENKLEANYELLYSSIRKTIPVRSLLVLFTNFESTYGLERVLPVLRKLSKQHLLLVVFFENNELIQYSQESSQTIKEIYFRMVAEKTVDEKEQIFHMLNLYGIQAIRTIPENLTIGVINKYLEFKSRGMI